MRDLARRLERLEQAATPQDRGYVELVKFIDVAEGGGPAPWEPQWAETKEGPGPERIDRMAGESADDFAQRIKGLFPEIPGAVRVVYFGP